MNTTRRQFLQASSTAGAGLLIGFSLHEPLFAETAAEFAPNAYIRISPDNVVRLWVTRSEMGQGVRTVLPMMLADELDVDLSKVIVEQAVMEPRFNGIRLRTSGSGSTAGTWKSVRTAAAAAREMLVTAAAQHWQVDASTCESQTGNVVHAPTKRRLSYGSLADAAAKVPVPKEPKLKGKDKFSYLGKPMKRRDGQAIVTGRAKYGLDTRLPGMLYAVVARSPVIGGTVQSVDARATMQVPGVRKTAILKSGIAHGVAVVADNTWAAIKGREALKVQWDPGANRDFDSDVFLRSMHTALDTPDEKAFPSRSDGKARDAIKAAASTFSADYEYPFQAHAPVEPMNCTVHAQADRCEIWVPTQAPEKSQELVAELLKLPKDSVRVNVTMLGGGFGRRLMVDYVVDAAELSQAIGGPVQVVWTRDDDTRHGFFHPPSVDRITAAFDDNGQLTAWRQRSIGSDMTMLGLPTADDLKDRNYYADGGTPWGGIDNPYAITNYEIDYVPVNSCVPSGPWRAVGYPGRVFSRESFLDELAYRLKKDAVELRLEMLPAIEMTSGPWKADRQRLARVLKLAAERSKWGKPLPTDGRLWGRGIACNVYHAHCYVAQVAEVSVSESLDDLRVHRVVCAVDCGYALNPLGIEGQVESNITWGLTAALRGKMDFKNGTAVQKSFADFRVMRMNEMPQIETHIVSSDIPPGGLGETAVPPIAPAVANAVFAATGKRIRSLPITTEKLQKT
jgi:isoquinoline 1-oxidoreductase subunit beta